jgi:proteasome lid subunit RPN8/RPN11
MKSPPATAQATWSVPQCPFTVEYTPRVLDDIRLAAVDAFLLPGGGIEIGGILLGRYAKGHLQIQDHLALPVEHASGTPLVLSPKDHSQLAAMLATARGNPAGGQPIGWYHSHPRGEISLSDCDVEIYRRYFPEPWQVALVLKPHTHQPTIAGFFFREQDGTIRQGSCYQPIVMEALVVRPLPEVALRQP